MRRLSFAFIILFSAAAATAAPLPPDRIKPDEHGLGRTDAPVTLIEYFSQGCTVCARFDREVFPLLKAKYIDTGKVRYVMRLYPLFAVDGPAYKLDRCVPPGRFFTAADMLFRNQPLWDNGEFPLVDAHTGLIHMAGMMGLSAKQADACMNDTALDAAINSQAKDADAHYHIEGTPTFVINFKKADLATNSWQEIQTALDAALAADISPARN